MSLLGSISVLPALFLQVKPGSSKFRLESGETKTRDGKTGDKGGETGDKGGKTGDKGGETGDKGGKTGDKGGKTGDKGGGLWRSLLEELDSQAGSCEQAGGARYCC